MIIVACLSGNSISPILLSHLWMLCLHVSFNSSDPGGSEQFEYEIDVESFREKMPPVGTVCFLADIFDAVGPSELAVASVSPVPGQVPPALTGKVTANMPTSLCCGLDLLGLPANRYHGRLIFHHICWWCCQWDRWRCFDWL